MGYHRSIETKRRYKKLYKEVQNWYYCGVWYSEKKDRYIRVYSGGRRAGTAKWFRKQSNKKVRMANEVYNYSKYKRLYDYWWALY